MHYFINSITCSLLFFVTILLFGVQTQAQTVTVGKGSYSTTLPSGEIGPQNFAGQNVLPKISDSFNQTATNK